MKPGKLALAVAPALFKSTALLVRLGSVFAALSIAGVAADAAQQLPAKFSIHEAPKSLADIRFQDADGKALSLADFRGKAVLLNVWATWCAPCRKEMPTLDRLQDALGGPAFMVLALSVDRAGIDAVRKFFGELKVQNLAIFIDATARSATELGALGLPATLLIDREGREIGRLIGPSEWDTPEMIAFLRGQIEK